MDSGLRVAVTGAAGSVGAQLVRRLAAEPAVRRVLALDARPLPDAGGAVVNVERDIRQPLFGLLYEHHIDVVVHLAFQLRPGRDREAARRVNVGGMAQVLRACKEVDVRRLVYLSSATVYGARPGAPQPYTEDMPVRPVRGFQYAEDKAATELMLDAFAADNRGVCVTTLRSCVIMGPRSENFITQALRKPALVRAAGNDPPMQFLHEDDAQAALMLCATNDVPGVYNLAGTGAVAFSEVARTAGRRCLPVPAPLLTAVTQATWALRLQSDSPASGLAMVRWPWLVDTGKLEEATGFRPKYTSRQALQASPLAASAGAHDA